MLNRYIVFVIIESILNFCVSLIGVGSNSSQFDVEVSTKTPQSVRDIPVGGDNLKLIYEILEYSRNDYLFSDYDGKPFATNHFSNYLYRVSKSCGIKVYPLLMRKSFSANLYAQGVNPAVTKSLMGHKYEDMSLNAYATASKTDLINTALNRKFKK